MAKFGAFAPIYSDATFEYFRSLSKRKQRRFIDLAHELASYPAVTPDFTSKDAEGRDICHLIIEGHLFDYWVDHGSKQVLIISVESAD